MSTQTRQLNRITVKLKTPNPLFEKWIMEWRDSAKENNSKMQFTFNNALKTLKKYPLPLQSGKDCIILKGFGNKLCEMLDKKLLQHKNQNNLTNQPVPLNVIRKSPKVTDKESQPKRQKITKSPKKSKLYQPAKGSGAYAILLSIFKQSQESNYSGSLSKAEIIEHARHLSDKSFTKPDSGSFYTAWSSMTTLVSKGLIIRKGSPPKFSLTDEGDVVALKLFENSIQDQDNEENSREININSVINSVFNENDENLCVISKTTDEQIQPTIINAFKTTDNKQLKDINYPVSSKTIANKILPSTSKEIDNLLNSQSSTSSKTSVKNKNITTDEEVSSQISTEIETLIFAPESFDIILLVDTQETTGGTRNPLDDETISELNKYKINFEVRHLKVGDFTWICRERNTKSELILPYIVERKRMDDLGHSIKDGRFHEQKFRLKQCGIQNLLYIVESYGNNSRTVLPLSSLLQAATNTLIQDQFQVKFTENHRHSMQYLSGFTLMLNHIYQKKTVMSCAKDDLSELKLSDDLIPLMPFKDFNKGASKMKNFKVKDIFVRQLLQLKGVSVDKALAIVDKYPTPKLLKIEYDRLGSQGEKLLANISFGALKKSIGPVISQTVYQLYTFNKLV